VPSTKSNKKPKHSWRFEAIGTQWVIETPEKLEENIRLLIGGRIDTFDMIYSRFRDDSFVARIAREPGTYEFPDDVIELIDIYYQLYEATNGALTPLIGDSLSALGYDKNYSLKKKRPKPVPTWGEVMQWNGRKVTTYQPAIVDFGAVGKGYLVDEIAKILEINEVGEYIIDASGDIRHRGGDIQVIGLENPYDSTMVIGVATVQNKSLCASASNRRSWGEGLHHVIDGRTGKPTNDVIATWVVADSTALADGFATALFFVPPSKLRHIAEFQFVRLHTDGHIEHSPDFVGELYI
jgi:thiamine biosynthesis lipoprotein